MHRLQQPPAITRARHGFFRSSDVGNKRKQHGAREQATTTTAFIIHLAFLPPPDGAVKRANSSVSFV